MRIIWDDCICQQCKNNCKTKDLMMELQKLAVYDTRHKDKQGLFVVKVKECDNFSESKTGTLCGVDLVIK